MRDERDEENLTGTPSLSSLELIIATSAAGVCFESKYMELSPVGIPKVRPAPMHQIYQDDHEQCTDDQHSKCEMGRFDVVDVVDDLLCEDQQIPPDHLIHRESVFHRSFRLVFMLTANELVSHELKPL